MAHLNLKANNFYNVPIIKEDNFNELMISNDEDHIFGEFIRYLQLIIKNTTEGNYNVIDIKRLFSINLKNIDILMFSDDWKEFSEQEVKDLKRVYDKTHYIVNNIESLSNNKKEIIQAITIVNNFWSKKLEEQKILEKTLDQSSIVLDDKMNKLNHSLKIKEISDFAKIILIIKVAR